MVAPGGSAKCYALMAARAITEARKVYLRTKRLCRLSPACFEECRRHGHHLLTVVIKKNDTCFGTGHFLAPVLSNDFVKKVTAVFVEVTHGRKNGQQVPVKSLRFIHDDGIGQDQSAAVDVQFRESPTLQELQPGFMDQ